MAGNTQSEPSDGAGAPDASASSADADAAASDVATEASAQSASTASADAGSAGGTTVSIAVYRSSFPIDSWNLNDEDFGITKAEWASADVALPERGTPGAEVEWERPTGYEEPTRAGFEFAGWSTSPSAPYGGFLDPAKGPLLTMPEGAPESGSYVLYALWTPNEYSIVFDLAKNPNPSEGPLAETSFELNWDTDADSHRTVRALGEGGYRVDGFTMDEAGYDPDTRTVMLPEPARSGYRFLGWSEPDGQGLVVEAANGAGFALNPVRLTQLDGTPVLTARWASAFGVTAPISVTFGDYDKTGVPGNPSLGATGSSAASDTTQSEADDPDKGAQEGYEAKGQAYFENTSWHDSIRMVGLESVRDPDANAVLTTYDSSKAEEADVLGGQGSDGTLREGERLLSMYPAASPSDASAAVHFRLDDSLKEADLEAFAMGGKDSESKRINVSYGLNLSTDPVTGKANHGLVLETNDYDRMPIAQLTYTFALGDPVSSDPIDFRAFWTIDDDGSTVFDLKKIGADAAAISAGDQAMTAKYTRWMNDDHRFYVRWFDKGVTENQATIESDSTIYEVRIIGVNYDSSDRFGVEKNALTFQFVDVLNMDVPNAANLYRYNDSNTSTGGWFYSELRRKMQPNNWHDTDHGNRSLDSAIWKMVPSELQERIVGTMKYANQCNVPPTDNFSNVGWMTDKLFIASYAEIAGSLPEVGVFAGTTATYLKERPLNGAGSNMSTPYPYYSRFSIVGNVANSALIKGEQRYKLSDGSYSRTSYWSQRSAHPSSGVFKSTTNTGEAMNASYNSTSSTARGIVPCFCL